MMSLAASLTLFAFIAVGGVAHQHQAMRSEAVIYYQDGHNEKVRVLNSGQYFCPSYCRVDHQHLVHDIRSSCADRVECDHFTVLHVIIDEFMPNVSKKLPAKGDSDPLPTAAVRKSATWAGSRTP